MKLVKAALVMICVSLFPLTAFAEDVEATTNGTQNVELYANVVSSYTVKLPRKVDVKNNETSFEIEIKGDIAGDEKLTVTVPESASLLETAVNSHNSIALTVANEKNVFTYSDLKSDYVSGGDGSSTVSITHSTIPAGNWSVNLPIVIALA